MLIDPHNLSSEATERLISGIVVPRPIAWITTVSTDGVIKLAPFSFFTPLSSKPPLVGISIGRNGERRSDTGMNIHLSGEFVVNVGDATHALAIYESSGACAGDVSQANELGLLTIPSDIVKVPRLVDVPVSMECRLERVIPFGEKGFEFFVGEVMMIHVREGLVNDGEIDSRDLNPVCRISGPNYSTGGGL